MDRTAIPLLIALGLLAYGLYTAVYIPGMLIGPPAPILFVGFTAQAVCAALAGIGILTRQRWARFAVLLLGAAIAVTNLWAGFVLGIVPYLRALAIAVAAIIGAVWLATFLARRPDVA